VIGLAAALGLVVAERMRARLDAPARDETPPEPLVLERPPYDPLPEECEGAVPLLERTFGDATLRLRLRDDRDGEPAAMRVRLWRLDVPEDAEWSEGDELRAAIDVPEEGVTIERLPAGRYRIQCFDAREAPDPPEFELADGVNEREVDVPVRRWFRLRLRIVDEHGEVVRRSMRCEGGRAYGKSYGPEPVPSWASPRRSRVADDLRNDIRGYGNGDGIAQDTGPIVSADGDGYFDVGRYREDGRLGYDRSSKSFVMESRASVGVSVGWDSHPAIDSTLVAVAPSHAAILAHVILPNGETVRPSAARVSAWSQAHRGAWDSPPDTWRTIPVDVTVTVPDCEPLTFVWTAATADEEHALLPLPPSAIGR
jgi:hypothetical protein